MCRSLRTSVQFELYLERAGPDGTGGLKNLAGRLGPGGIFAFRHLETDIDIFGRTVAAAADALDWSVRLHLFLIDALWQVGDHSDCAIIKADGPSVLARFHACRHDAVGVFERDGAIEPVADCLGTMQRLIGCIL